MTMSLESPGRGPWVCERCGKSVPAGPVVPSRADKGLAHGQCYACDDATRWRRAEPLTPVEQYGEFYVKRDDAYERAGVRGGKVRTCWRLAQGAVGLVTAGSRSSPQVNIVAHIARELGVPCRVHTPQGELSPEVADAAACGAEVVQHPAGYNSVITARARDDAASLGWTLIPFGMECEEAVRATASQADLPPGVRRVIVPVGSGMTLAGILTGLARHASRTPVVGVSVGADPTARLQRWAPDYPGLEIVPPSSDYHAPAPSRVSIGGADLVLDPHYEAKAAAWLGPRLEPGDLLWVVGIRRTAEG